MSENTRYSNRTVKYSNRVVMVYFRCSTIIIVIVWSAKPTRGIRADVNYTISYIYKIFVQALIKSVKWSTLYNSCREIITQSKWLFCGIPQTTHSFYIFYSNFNPDSTTSSSGPRGIAVYVATILFQLKFTLNQIFQNIFGWNKIDE